MNDPEPIDDLILRSILGETTRQEEKELREALAQDPTLLERRKKLAETARLLSEVHGVPYETETPRSSPVPIWLRSLRGMSSVGSGIAAGLIILFLLFPALDRARESQPLESSDRELGTGVVTMPSFEAQSPPIEFKEFGTTVDLDTAPSGNRQSSGSSFMRPRPSPSQKPSNVSAVIVDSSSVLEEEPTFGIKDRSASDTNLNPTPEPEERASTRTPDAVGWVTTAATRSEYSGATAAPQAPPPPPVTTDYEDFGNMNGEITRRNTRSDARAPVSRSRNSSLSVSEPLPAESLSAEFDRAGNDTRDLNDSSPAIIGGYLFRGGEKLNAPMDDPFAATRTSLQPASSQLQSARETTKVDRIEGALALGQLFADETDSVENASASNAAKLKKREVAAQPMPVPEPADPPPAATFTETVEDNFSAFSLNVTDVSFQLAARQLEQGITPDPRSIRQEEFYNAFDYRDPAPSAGEPVRFEVESATLPASHNLKVVRLAVKTAAQSSAGKPAQITFAIDNSGSMQRSDRKRTIEAAFEKLTDGLRPQDRINIVTFATDSRVELLQSSPTNSVQIQAALNSAPEGGTNLENGLATAYEVASRFFQPDCENRVILLSDGIANLGQTEADQLVEMIEKYRNQGIAFDGFGIGWENLNDPLLSELARNGDGQYAFLNSPDDAGPLFAQALSSSLQSVARDVKVQVEWNPDRVQRFRLVGYDTHLLKKEDFRNDAVDAAEMAAEETGNALYLVELKPNGTGPLGTARVRFKMEEPPSPPSAEAERILQKLESVVIPRVTFSNTSLPTAAQALTGLISENNPDRSSGVGIVVREGKTDRQVNFSVRNLPAIRILDIMSQQTGYHWDVTDSIVSFSPRDHRPTANNNQTERISVEERSWIIPNPPVWPEIDSASARLQLSTAAAIFADKLQDANRFTAVDRAQLLSWTQQAQSFFNDPAEIETLANMIRNANFLP